VQNWSPEFRAILRLCSAEQKSYVASGGSTPEEIALKLISYERLKPEKGIEYCRDHLRRKVRAGEFPKPIPVSDRRIAWIEAEVDEWLAARAAERDAGGAV
jgi:prophage regulatory protein